jgi:hypothetical protein
MLFHIKLYNKSNKMKDKKYVKKNNVGYFDFYKNKVKHIIKKNKVKHIIKKNKVK